MTFKKNKIAILIMASLPFSSWAKTADFDESGLNKIIFDGTDTSLLSVGTLYPKDANNKYISENNLVVIDYTTDKANTVLKKVFGGLCNGISESCYVTNTNVIINNGFINSDSGVGIYGAYANAKNNAGAQGRIYLNNSAEVIGNIYAAYAQSYNTVKDATANAVGDVYLNDTAKVTGDVQGAYAYALSNANSDATLTGNVYLNDNSVVSGNVYGAYSHIQTNSGLYARSETQGSVYLNNNTSVTGNVYGARDFVNAFANNTSGTIAQANISGQIYLNNNASIKGDIYGTYVYAHAYSYNNFDVNATATATSDIFLNDNTAVSGNIYATYFDEFSSLPGSLTAIGQGNVSILGNVKLQDDSSGIVLYNSEIWGGYLKNSVSYYDIFTNNTFSMGANALTIDKMGNFESYKFYLNDYNKHVINDSNVALVTVTGQIKNSSTVLDNNGTTITTTNQSMAKIDGISGKNIVKKGDTIVLINANGAALEKKIETFGGSTSTVSMSDLFANTPANNTVALGLIRKADISYAIDNTNQTITAKIENIRTYADAIKPLAEGRIASLQNTVRGADELINIMGDNKTVGTFTPIAVVNGGINKYNSGSSVDTRDYRIMVGSRYQFLEQLYSGMTLEYGRSNYDTHNNLATGKIDGDGHSANYGFSLFSKYNHDIDVGNVYLDAVLRFGRTSTEFKSNDIILGSGEIAHYKSKVNYIGGSVGTGYIYPFNEKSNFDSSARYFYTRLGSDSMVLDGDKINFKKSTSSRVQLKEQYNYQSSANLTFYLAGIYEYEFDGKANANVSGISIDAPSLQGSTGVMELGIKSVPIADNKNVLFDLSFKGYSGKRDGAAMSAAIEYDF